MTVENLILEEIEEINERLKGLDVTSKEYSILADRLDKLMAKSLEIGKVNIEAAQKEQQMEDDRKDRKTRNVISVLGIAVPAGVSIWGALKSWKFDSNGGMITSDAGRHFISNLFRFKK